MLAYFSTPFGFWYGFVYLIVFSMGIQAAIQCFFLLKMARVRQKPLHYILYAGLVYLLFFLGVLLPPLSDFLGSLLGVLSVLLFTRFVLKQRGSLAMFLAFLIMTVTIMVESLLTPLLSILLRVLPLSGLAMQQIGIWCFVLFSMLLYGIYTKFFAMEETIKNRLLWILAAPLLFICLILRPYIAVSYPKLFRYGQAISHTSLSEDAWVLVISLAAMLAVSSILFAYQKLILQSKLESDALLLHTQIAAQKSYVEELKQRYDATNRFRHDFKNHTTILSGLISERDFEKASAYLSRFHDCYQDMAVPVSTGNTTLDILLSEKLHLAKQQGITLQVDVDMGSNVGLDHFDLCTIFANALDNAIKGAKSLEKESRRIYITAKPHKDFYVVDIINCFDESKYETGRGIGLPTIKMIAEKYQGSVDISHTDTEFRLSILLPLP